MKRVYINLTFHTRDLVLENAVRRFNEKKEGKK